ncbi:AAA family ATPase [Flavobacterium sp. HXWNR29]|uniref:AAA family ATPase n=1 Tax=Flavobacterium odoriferum TaxID=2946604 RepID=UPI0021CB6133|nr:AAA family ATPase [Flavobacterium sp. HXWNR29]MCU4188640.1 AAA family ATPase [Flavobacterium sp. HXWNR29]
MKIQKLEIKHLRGITDLKIEPKGKSFVVYGPNGSGKSAVIDALDFLLTGKIARLNGEGTEGVSLKEHGPHIDSVSDIDKVIVSAEIIIPGIPEAILMTRKMKKPSELIYDSKFEIQLKPIIELLNRGQYVFTRREILKLITAKSSTRSQEIQKVLKLSELEEIRTNLVRVYNENKREYKAAEDNVKKSENEINAITGHEKYSDSEVLKFINEQREKLGGNELEKLSIDTIQVGITSVSYNPLSVNHENLSERLNKLRYSEIQKSKPQLIETEKIIKTAIEEIKLDSLANWNSKRLNLTKEGLSLIPETGECPLCDTEWPVGDLEKILQDRIETVIKRQKDINENSIIIKEIVESFKTKVSQLFELLKQVNTTESFLENEKIQTGIVHFNDLKTSLEKLSKALENPIKDFSNEDFKTDDVSNLFVLIDNKTIIKDFEDSIKLLFPEATPEQSAWDNLIKLIERLKILADNKNNLLTAHAILEKSTLLVQAYVEARNEVLESLYDKIKDRFVELYKEMHGDDEIDFNATFVPQDAGLDLSVDFYGRGYHPPHAMHSEGHQDSMGICLFLALSEHLNTGLIELVILDDVVMSVDTGHRRAFCNVLTKYFPNIQFIITTHDTTWANQLKSAGVVPGKQMLKFSNWTVEKGPSIHYEADMWGRIQKDLDNDDVSSAAAKLRRGMEEFSRYVCHNLKASVPYSLDDAGSLGDLLPAAISRYKDLMGKAKDAANSWNQTTIIEDLKKIDDESKAIISKTGIEQWNINKAVHYNEWANFQKQDFQPVVDAFKDLYEKVFACSNCQAVLQITFDGSNISGVKCKCGNTNWNLIKK